MERNQYRLKLRLRCHRLRLSWLRHHARTSNRLRLHRLRLPRLWLSGSETGCGGVEGRGVNEIIYSCMICKKLIVYFSNRDLHNWNNPIIPVTQMVQEAIVQEPALNRRGGTIEAIDIIEPSHSNTATIRWRSSVGNGFRSPDTRHQQKLRDISQFE